MWPATETHQPRGAELVLELSQRTHRRHRTERKLSVTSRRKREDSGGVLPLVPALGPHVSSNRELCAREVAMVCIPLGGVCT